MNTIKIAFSGIGGVGGYYGGLLAHQYKNSENVEVHFISRGDNLKAIEQKGLEIKTTEKTFVVYPTSITNNPETIGIVDFLFCCTKSYDLAKNINQLRPLIGEQTTIIPLLNGANIVEQIQALLPQQDIWKGCVYIGARLTQPGFINKFSVKDKLLFGGSNNQDKQNLLLSLLLDAGINAFNPKDIEVEIWKKFFMISTAATITSYYNDSIGNVIEQHYDMFIKLGQELKTIADKEGIALPDNVIESSIETQKMMPAGSTTSMHSDFKRGGENELETLTGYVLELGKQYKVPTPTYEMMYNHLTKKSSI